MSNTFLNWYFCIYKHDGNVSIDREEWASCSECITQTSTLIYRLSVFKESVHIDYIFNIIGIVLNALPKSFCKQRLMFIEKLSFIHTSVNV